MKNIDYKLSDKLYNKLNEIRIDLSYNEKCEVTFDDLIEEALLSYYNIKIVDINNDNNIIDSINNSKNINNYYVYAFYNMKIKKYTNIGNFHFYYEPIYFGKGKDNRINDLINRDENLIEIINDLKSTNDFYASKIIYDLSEKDALYFEQLFINHFGRLCDGSGILYNKREGNSINIKILNDNVGLNLEYNKITMMINELNILKKIKLAAKKINMNERTFYRNMKKYSIKKDKITKIWYIDNNVKK